MLPLDRKPLPVKQLTYHGKIVARATKRSPKSCKSLLRNNLSSPSRTRTYDPAVNSRSPIPRGAAPRLHAHATIAFLHRHLTWPLRELTNRLCRR